MKNKNESVNVRNSLDNTFEATPMQRRKTEVDARSCLSNRSHKFRSTLQTEPSEKLPTFTPDELQLKKCLCDLASKLSQSYDSVHKLFKYFDH